MRLDKIQLLHTIYKYFPKGLMFADIEYDNSSQTRLKLKMINSKKRENYVLFAKLVNRLRGEVSEGIINQSPLFDKEFCNYLMFDIKVGKFFFRFHILLSFLEPFHSIVITCYNQDFNKLIFTGDFEEIKTKNYFSDREEEIVLSKVKIIEEEITNIFQTTDVKMSELLDIIPDIETGGKELGEVTFFDCLFTNFLQLY